MLRVRAWPRPRQMYERERCYDEEIPNVPHNCAFSGHWTFPKAFRSCGPRCRGAFCTCFRHYRWRGREEGGSRGAAHTFKPTTLVQSVTSLCLPTLYLSNEQYTSSLPALLRVSLILSWCISSWIKLIWAYFKKVRSSQTDLWHALASGRQQPTLTDPLEEDFGQIQFYSVEILNIGGGRISESSGCEEKNQQCN